MLSRVKATIFFSSSNFLLKILTFVRTIYMVSFLISLLGAGFIYYPSFWHIVTDMLELDLLNLDTANLINCDGITPQDVQHPHDVQLSDSQTEVNDASNKAIYKNPYVIGAAIGVVAVCLALWFYLPSNSLPDDNKSI